MNYSSQEQELTVDGGCIHYAKGGQVLEVINLSSEYLLYGSGKPSGEGGCQAHIDA